MRFKTWCLLLCCLASVSSLSAATGRVIKVLPQFIDTEGRNALSPSLYDRDAYQVVLRQHPEKRSGFRFYIQWKVKRPVWSQLILRAELRGIAQGKPPKELVLETPIEPGGWFSSWTTLTVAGDDYKAFGDITAWRVTLWEGEEQLSEQKSFLW